MPNMIDQLSMARTPAMPEAVNVYDAQKGHYYDPACGKTLLPTPSVLPGAPMPFTNLRSIK